MGRNPSHLSPIVPPEPRAFVGRAPRAARLLACLGLAGFALTRVILHGGLPPFFEGDSYKYLGGADSLRAGLGLPPLFRDLPVTGGVLHAVPGYAWFLRMVWALAGGICLAAVPWANAAVALAGYLAAADLMRRLDGALPGALLLVLLAWSPPLAWLEHLLMPDVLAAPIFFLAAWIVVVALPRSERSRTAFGLGAVCGALAALLLMLRVGNQTLLLPLPLLAFVRCPRARALACWAAGCVVAATVGLAPWLAFNHSVHGVARLSASQGRHLRFSQLWTDAEERRRVAAEQGTPAQASADDAYVLMDRDLQSLVTGGLSVVQADAELGRRARERYRDEPWSAILAQRMLLLRQFFVEEDATALRVQSPATKSAEILANADASRGWREWTVERLGYPYSDEFVAAHEALGKGSDRARAFVAAWMRGMTLDGLPLLAAYAVGLVLLGTRGQDRAAAFLVFGAFPLLWIVVSALVGLPRYRYQVALHPFELATIVLAAGSLLRRLRGKSDVAAC